jgi:hypothetical protein
MKKNIGDHIDSSMVINHPYSKSRKKCDLTSAQVVDVSNVTYNLDLRFFRKIALFCKTQMLQTHY